MNTETSSRQLRASEARVAAAHRRHSLLLVSVPVVTVAAFVAALPLLRNVVSGTGLWASAEIVMPIALFGLVLTLAWYSVVQDKRIRGLRQDLSEARSRMLHARLEHRSRLAALGALSEALGEENDPRQVFNRLALLCQEVFCSDRVSLMVLDNLTHDLVVTSAVGIENLHEVIGSRRALGEGVAGWVARTREPLLLGPGIEPPDFKGKGHGSALRSAMVMPLEVRGKLAGVLSVANDLSQVNYDADDLTTLKVFAKTAEYCIRHAETSDWMRGLIDGLRDLHRDPAQTLSGRHVVYAPEPWER